MRFLCCGGAHLPREPPSDPVDTGKVLQPAGRSLSFTSLQPPCDADNTNALDSAKGKGLESGPGMSSSRTPSDFTHIPTPSDSTEQFQLHAPSSSGTQQQLSPTTSLPASFEPPGRPVQRPPRAGGTMTASELFSDLTHLVFLGAGAYGAVYEGVWHGAVVAIKFIRSDSLDPASASVREAALSSMLSHPHVVQTFWSRSALLDAKFVDTALREHTQLRAAEKLGPDFCSGEGFGDPYGDAPLDAAHKLVTTFGILHALAIQPGQYITAIAMEFCDDTSLHAAIAKGLFQPSPKWGHRIVLRALSRSAREVARGMWHLHCSGVIHGDLKPANVLLKHARTDRRGFVCKVSDFGLSRECIGANGSVRADTWSTLSYMAPENFEGQMCQASDEMYTGVRPLKNYTFGQVMKGVSSGSLHAEWPPDAPPALASLSQRCMTRKPADRPTFDAIIRDLNSMEDGMRNEEFCRRASLLAGGGGSVGSEFSTASTSVLSVLATSESCPMSVLLPSLPPPQGPVAIQGTRSIPTLTSPRGEGGAGRGSSEITAEWMHQCTR